MVSTLSAGWNVFLAVAVPVCIIIAVINVRRETGERKEIQQESKQ